uniref:Rx_N domain-containing protein n=1 Tax=Syphacia muris TaxID=451379 RepID=A0A0N5AXU2_9BILA
MAYFLGLLRTKIDQTKMDPADKLARLMQALTGSAKRLVREFAITRVNYPVVLAKLKDEYSNLAKIRLNLQQRLRELSVIRRETDIIPVLDEIELILHRLMSVGTNLCDEAVQEYLEDAIMDKLPLWLMSQIHLRRDMAKECNTISPKNKKSKQMKSSEEVKYQMRG